MNVDGVVVVGDVVVDIKLRPEQERQDGSDTPSEISWKIGGQATNVAIGLAELDTPVTLIGRVGADPAATVARTVVADCGVHTHFAVDLDRPTGTVVSMIERSERHMYNSRGASGNLQPEDLDTADWTRVEHLFVSGYVLLAESSRAAGIAALDAASKNNVPVTVDPSSVAPLRAVGADVFLGWLPPNTTITPNLDEARFLSSCDDPEEALKKLSSGTFNVVMTAGRNGALWSDGETILKSPSPRVDVDSDVDPVGAGDAFTAAWLAGRDLPVQERLDRAVQFATTHITASAQEK